MPFDEAAHPRGKAGTATGGEFVAGQGGGATGKSVLGLKAKDASLPTEKGGKGGGKGKKGGGGKAGAKGKGKTASPEQKATAVKGVQTLLNKLGIKDAAGKPLAVDGIVGPKTTSAIKAAQRKYGLPASGKLTPQLLKRLRQPRMAKSSLTAKPKPKLTPKPPARRPPPVQRRPGALDRRSRAPSTGPQAPPGGG